jgi:hypothetical protein
MCAALSIIYIQIEMRETPDRDRGEGDEPMREQHVPACNAQRRNTCISSIRVYLGVRDMVKS